VNITLTKDLAKFVAGKVRSGGYTNPDEVVRAALREFRAKDDPAESDSQELAELLLAAVRGPHRPLTQQNFAQLRQRARHKPARA
jgi:putative addiction module CopG family antidote